LLAIILQYIIYGTASARTSDPGARIGHLLSHTIRIRKHISRRIMMLQSVLRMLRTPFLMLRTLFQCCEHLFPCCEHLFPCCEYLFPCCEQFFHVAPLPPPDIVYMLRVMLRVCGEHVTSLWRACCDQHPNTVLRTFFPCCEQLFPCCEHFFHVAPPSLLPRHSVHIASDVTSLWRACCELVASMLRSPSKHQMQGW
jgi:hypothetical protein